MSTDYKPGTVAIATVRGVPNVRVWRYGGSIGWITAENVKGLRLHYDMLVTDIRPLVVLDLDGYTPAGVRQVVADLRREEWDDIADAIEAQTKPPRIPEPGWGEKVIASTRAKRERRPFVHAYAGVEEGIWTDAAGEATEWSDLIDPEVSK